MIPKIIHYVWLGKTPLPEKTVRCIDSWKRYCPDYEIIEWNEDNINLDSCLYAKQAYKARKWAFVSDYVRLFALERFGGIYLDTDVEILRPLDSFLSLKCFLGFESSKGVATCIMAAEKGHSFIHELMREYDGISFAESHGIYDLTTNVTRVTRQAIRHGLKLNNEKQTVCDCTVFPRDYFCPLNIDTGVLECSENTFAIHWLSGSWKSEKEKRIRNSANRLRRTLQHPFGTPVAAIYELSSKVFCVIHEEGIFSVCSRIRMYFRKNKALK